MAGIRSAGLPGVCNPPLHSEKRFCILSEAHVTCQLPRTITQVAIIAEPAVQPQVATGQWASHQFNVNVPLGSVEPLLEHPTSFTHPSPPFLSLLLLPHLLLLLLLSSVLSSCLWPLTPSPSLLTPIGHSHATPFCVRLSMEGSRSLPLHFHRLRAKT